MNRFLENLRREAEQNPTVTLAIAAALLTGAGKFLDSAGRYKGSSAYAKDVDRRVKAAKKGK